MRKLLLTFSLILGFFTFQTNAQLADGSDAPNWTLTDINGNSYTLYDILDQGKPVALDFSATWCGPCWSYHNTGILEQLYDEYGPNGTDEIMVFYIEADLGTNLDCLYGLPSCVGGTQGDWVSGTNYPIINLTGTNGPNVAASYNINYFPTLYAISPDKKAYEMGAASLNTWENWLLGSFKLEATGVTTDAICAGDGEIDLQVTGGATPLTYEWSTGSTQQDLSGLNTGEYSVTVTDLNRFEIVVEFIVDGPQEQLNLENYSLTDISCHGENDGSLYIDPSGGFPGYSIEWSNGDTNNSLEALEPGVYSVVVTDNMGCTITESYVIVEPDQLTTTYTINNSTCNLPNGSIYFDAEGGNGNHRYQISNGNPPTLNPYFPGLAPNSYTYNVSDDNGCVISGSFQLQTSGVPDATSTASGDITCTANQVNVNGVAGSNYSYLWTTSNGNIVSGENSISAVVDTAGTYNLRVTDNSSGCSSTSAVQVAQNVTFSALSVSGGELTCSATSAEICGTSALPITWHINGVDYTQNCVAVNAAGQYAASVTNPDNGCITTATSTVTLSTDLPQISVAPPSTLTCTVPELTLIGSIVGDINNYTISWSTVNGNIVSGDNSLTPVVNAGGDYLFSALNNTTQCQSTLNVVVSADVNIPQSQFTSSSANGTLTLQNTSNVINGSATWTLPDGTILTGETVNATFAASGTYSICLAVTNECGTNTNCTDVQYYTALALNGTTANPSCNAQSTGSITSNVTGGPITGDISYAWSGPNGFTSTEANLINVPAGTYTCVITDAVGLTTTNTFTITEPSAIEAASTVVNTTNGESNGSISLTISGGTGDHTVLWSNGLTGSSISNLAAGEYSAVITDANGCPKNVGPIVVATSTSVKDPSFVSVFKVYPNPAINFVNLDFASNEILNDAKVIVYNHLGMKVIEKRFSGKSYNDKLDVSQLTSGLYMIELNTTKGNALRRVIITE